MKKLSYLLLVLAVSSTYASPLSAKKFPTDLQYNNKPIDALCFNQQESSDVTIKLDQCGLEHEKLVKRGTNSYLTKKGFVGYDWKDAKASYPSGGYSYYQAFKADNNNYWIYTINNGGGSGDFTELNLVTRVDDKTLKINAIAGGDRCNGGIKTVENKDAQLNFSTNMTAFDFLTLAKSNPHQLKAYDDLAACAVCCVALANYTIDASHKPQLKEVDFSALKDPKEMPQQGAKQTCFNQLLAKFGAKYQFHFNPEQLNEFTKEFNDSCVDK
jgi:hypothetical protein